MNDKRGLSSIVTTVLVIVVSIVALAIIAAVVLGLVNKGADRISLSQFTVDLGIKSAKIDFSSGQATVSVERGVGMGDLVGIKFVFEDDKTSEVFDRHFEGFDELESRTFYINLTQNGSQLVLPKVEKVSIAPVIKLESGKEVIGKVTDSVGDLNIGANFSGGSDPNQGDSCQVASDCGEDYLLDGTRYCEGNNVFQYKVVYSCSELGFCYNDQNPVYVESCSYECYDGNCIDEPVSCTPETVDEDCGVDQYIGVLSCSQDGTAVVQDYKDYSCVDSVCQSTITVRTIEECNESEVCFQGECFVPAECVEHIDCDPGEVCEDGVCVTEEEENSGTINSIWPFGVGEYFDSADLTNPSIESYVGHYIYFPGSAQQGCLIIKEHNWKSYPEGYPYVRLNETETNISAGDSFSIWETSYICSTL
ncbi:hypothetical protein B6U91_01830 [Candidatus Pacearchaeota archaeon ex4484_71]|nr:MAG: hypothetical protein B6U91_01830 [Candidatus Pacearchaeota archaeon ex4484_71]